MQRQLPVVARPCLRLGVVPRFLHERLWQGASASIPAKNYKGESDGSEGGREAERGTQKKTSFSEEKEREEERKGEKTGRAWCSSFRRGARTIQLHPR